MSDNEKIEMTGTEAVVAQSTSKPAKQSKEKKAPKADGNKGKPGVFQRIARWFREMKSELKKVIWPTPGQTMNNTAIVILCVLIAGVFIWIFDWLAREIIAALLHLVGKS